MHDPGDPVGGLIDVEVVLATPPRQVLIALRVPPGSTVADVITASRLDRQFPDVPVAELRTGVWGRVVEREHVIRDGDRVELYRPLLIEPREARRQLARAGKTMGQAPRGVPDSAKGTD
jgi:putative ubiquitin-RnfH superfamily antitoxin RatB of RatAB toxin-antitoxin module